MESKIDRSGHSHDAGYVQVVYNMEMETFLWCLYGVTLILAGLGGNIFCLFLFCGVGLSQVICMRISAGIYSKRRLFEIQLMAFDLPDLTMIENLSGKIQRSKRMYYLFAKIVWALYFAYIMVLIHFLIQLGE